MFDRHPSIVMFRRPRRLDLRQLNLNNSRNPQPALPANVHHNKDSPVRAGRQLVQDRALLVQAVQARQVKVVHVHKDRQAPGPTNKSPSRGRDRSRESLNLDQDLRDLAVLVHPQINQVPSRNRLWPAPDPVRHSNRRRIVQVRQMYPSKD